MGVPLSPEPLVRSHREPIRSVRFRGVVPSDTMLPTRDFLASFALIFSEMAFFSSSPLRSANSLSASYFSFSSLGVPTRPLV